MANGELKAKLLPYMDASTKSLINTPPDGITELSTGPDESELIDYPGPIIFDSNDL